MGVRDYLGDPENIREINRAIRSSVDEERKGGGGLSRILVVEDDLLKREMLVRLLEREGYHVESTTSAEAMQVYCDAPADAVIADISSPEGEGLETIAALHEHFPEVKIIAISSTAGPVGSLVRVAKALGVARMLIRPFDSQRLLTAVKEVLGA